MAVTKEWSEPNMGNHTTIVARLDVGVNGDTWTTGLSKLLMWHVFDYDTGARVTDVTGNYATGVLTFATAGTNYIVYATGIA